MVSRVLASVYASFYQRNPCYFIRQLSYAAGLHILKNLPQPSLCQQFQPQLQPVQTDDPRPLTSTSQSRLEPSASTTSQVFAIQGLFLPDNDGTTVVNQNMPFINELGFVEHSAQEKAEELLLRTSPRRVQCKYCVKNMSVDAFRLVGTRQLFLYQNCRYLFEGVQYRSLYDHNFMFQQYNSQTCQIFIQALRPVYTKLL